MITASNEVKTAQNKTNGEVEDENTKRAFQGIKTSRPREGTIFSKEEEQEEHSSLSIQEQFRPKPPFSHEQRYAHNFKTQRWTRLQKTTPHAIMLGTVQWVYASNGFGTVVSRDVLFHTVSDTVVMKLCFFIVFNRAMLLQLRQLAPATPSTDHGVGSSNAGH